MGPINVTGDVFSICLILKDRSKARNERKKCSYPMQGDKSEVLPSAFTEASGIDVLPCLPIEQWASSICCLPLGCEQSQASKKVEALLPRHTVAAQMDPGGN